MKILITGGHLTPALSVISHLQKGEDVVYVGRKHALEGDSAVSLEYQEIIGKGIRFIAYHPARLQRVLTRYTFASLFRLPASVIKALYILQREKPNIVLSFGGYVALPIAFTAKLLGIPVVTHEQTFGAGATNKLIARFAQTICISWETSRKYFPADKTILTGNPVIPDTPSLETQKILGKIPHGRPMLTITGGSLGSHFLNKTIENILPQLLEKYVIFHQTGDAQEFKDYGQLIQVQNSLPRQLQERYHVIKFIRPEDISAFYKKADVVISRSGANTVQLLLLLNKPALLIPLPTGQKNEQKTNAEYFASTGLGECLSQNTLTGQVLLEKINQMIASLSSYNNSHFDEMRALHEKAADRIIECIYAAYKKNSS